MCRCGRNDSKQFIGAFIDLLRMPSTRAKWPRMKLYTSSSSEATIDQHIYICPKTMSDVCVSGQIVVNMTSFNMSMHICLLSAAWRDQHVIRFSCYYNTGAIYGSRVQKVFWCHSGGWRTGATLGLPQSNIKVTFTLNNALNNRVYRTGFVQPVVKYKHILALMSGWMFGCERQPRWSLGTVNIQHTTCVAWWTYNRFVQPQLYELRIIDSTLYRMYIRFVQSTVQLLVNIRLHNVNIVRLVVHLGCIMYSFIQPVV
jgi:hypothetical protein